MIRSTKPRASGSSVRRMVLPRLIAKWREHAKETGRDLGAAIDCASRTRLGTEARILERCARQLEKALARQNPKLSDRSPEARS